MLDFILAGMSAGIIAFLISFAISFAALGAITGCVRLVGAVYHRLAAAQAPAYRERTA